MAPIMGMLHEVETINSELAVYALAKESQPVSFKSYIGGLLMHLDTMLGSKSGAAEIDRKAAVSCLMSLWRLAPADFEPESVLDKVKADVAAETK